MDGESKPRKNTRSRARVATMVVVGVLAALAVGAFGQWPYAPIVGWAAACLVFVVWTWLSIGRSDAERTRQQASQEDPDRTTSDTLLLLASLASLVDLFFVFSQARSSDTAGRSLLAALGIVSIVLSWAFVHTLYTLRYAVLYFADDDELPVDFNQSRPPRYVDFAYFAFTVGMTFQVSDTNIHSSVVRSAVLRHAILSYVFGAVILAATVNIVAGLG